VDVCYGYPVPNSRLDPCFLGACYIDNDRIPKVLTHFSNYGWITFWCRYSSCSQYSNPCSSAICKLAGGACRCS
jgi:hypothetical protein